MVDRDLPCCDSGNPCARELGTRSVPRFAFSISPSSPDVLAEAEQPLLIRLYQVREAISDVHRISGISVDQVDSRWLSRSE